MKVPNTGGLAHILTMESYAKHLPKGAMNFFSGAGYCYYCYWFRWCFVVGEVFFIVLVDLLMFALDYFLGFYADVVVNFVECYILVYTKFIIIIITIRKGNT